MRKKIRIFALLSAAVLLLGGCGTPMYELTDEEQDLIIQYSAYTLAKHNIFQKDGMTSAVQPPAEPESEQDTKEPETETGTEEDKPQTPSGENSGSETNQSATAVSLAEAIGHGDDMSVSYDGYKVMNSYKVENYFSVDAEQGKKLVVMNFTMKNTGSKTIELDLLAEGIGFKGCFDGENRISEHISFGLNSLSSYEGKIKAGKSEKTILIFQIPEEQAKNIKSESLYVTLNDTIYSVKI